MCRERTLWLIYHPLYRRLTIGSRPLIDIIQQPLPRNIRNRNNKFDKNITKRGSVPIGKAAEREDESHVPKALILFFLVVVVGSSLVQVFNLFSSGGGPPPPIMEDEP
jgi:Ribosome associated membrane protein RAMP4